MGEGIKSNPEIFSLALKGCRKYGDPPYEVVVVHGGPGAPGGMAPVAEKLFSFGISVLEPFQSAESVDGQIEELKSIIDDEYCSSVCLIGYSWGAMLSLMFAAIPKQIQNSVFGKEKVPAIGRS